MAPETVAPEAALSSEAVDEPAADGTASAAHATAGAATADTATATATDPDADGSDTSATAADPAAPDTPAGRPSRAILAGAALLGVLLITVPFLITAGGDDPQGGSATGEGPGTVLGGADPGLPGSFGSAGPSARPAKPGGTAPASAQDAKDGQDAKDTKAGQDPQGAEAGDAPARPAAPGATAPAAGKATAGSTGKAVPPPADAGQPAGAPARAASTVVYSGVVGHGCPTPSGGGYRQVHYFTDGTDGWYTRTTAAWTGNGCDGSYAAVPMSGSTTTDTPDNRVMWWWKPGSRAKSCRISVYVPQSNTTLYVGGHPTSYHVLVDANDRTTKYASFRIDQAGHRGQWVDAGTFPVKGSTIGVKLLDRGDDWSAGWGKAHHAAAQMKAVCNS
ncbi:hypothetical protein [uncultured Streptomyces sp.]|uniref:hypothetical protein n=1 Tax=uncultured Streptomyces sp. TaxID=174707 RepID=UPI002607953E|nr:hypothetical protein [uncultured Streptomyces sp.]